MNHTPGKWEVYGEINVKDNNGDYICSCGSNRANQVENMKTCKANARLIASAPELLEQLKRLRLHMTDKYDAETTDIVIAKAEGKNA